MADVFHQEIMTAHMTNITEHHPPSQITTVLSAGLCLATILTWCPWQWTEKPAELTFRADTWTE